MSTTRSFAWLAAVLLASACGSGAPLQSECAPGQSERCACPSGSSSRRICTAEGRYGACSCEGQTTDGGAGVQGSAGTRGGAGTGAGGDVNGAAGTTGSAGTGATGSAGTGAVVVDGGTSPDAPPAVTGCVRSGKLIGGKETLIDLFTIDEGILVVRNDAILLLGRDGAVKKMVTATRPITTASFDGTSLVVGDAAMITVYSPALENRGTVLLTESCVSSVLMNGDVFVCGPSNDWDRIFYTYDVKGLKAIGRSTQKFTYHGRPMRRVAGTDYFITVTTDLSPSDFYLYKVLPGGTDVVYVNESPYHGDFAATTTYAFNATPATHLINVSGLMLRIFGDGCDLQHNSFTSGCFVKDGTLGLLPTGRSYLALANDATGRLFAVTNEGTQNYGYLSPLCPGGCNVQRIDVATRAVVTQRSHLMASRRFIALRPDTSCKMVALGYELATSTSSSDYGGYQIDLLEYGEP